MNIKNLVKVSSLALLFFTLTQCANTDEKLSQNDLEQGLADSAKTFLKEQDATFVPSDENIGTYFDAEENVLHVGNLGTANYLVGQMVQAQKDKNICFEEGHFSIGEAATLVQYGLDDEGVNTDSLTTVTYAL